MNTASPNVVERRQYNQLANIGFGFNNPTANLYMNAQLAPGIRVAHDQLSVLAAPQRDMGEGRLHPDRRVADRLRAAQGADEGRDGPRRATWRSTTATRTSAAATTATPIYNPFVGNYIMDASRPQIGGEAYLKTQNSSRWAPSPVASCAAPS